MSLNDKVQGWFEDLPDEHERITVSQWAERYRMMDDAITVDPGPWRNDRTPYLVEIMDCLSVTSPVREIAMMSGAQIGKSEIGNNWIGYTIHSAPAPMMFVSADQELVKAGIEVKIDRMIHGVEGMSSLIRPGVIKGHKKNTGDTVKRKDFAGGFLLSVSAGSPAQLRSFSVKNLFIDELDGFPLKTKTGEGDPLNIVFQRTKNFDAQRKVFYNSTPTTVERSKIKQQFDKGDKRRYYVPCPRCGHKQVLHFFVDKDTKSGIHFERDEKGLLVEGSVYYRCGGCGKKFYNEEKVKFLQGGEWRTEKGHRPVHKHFRSYHISSLYSPWYSWESLVLSFLDAYKDPEKLRTFYNTELGLPWEEMGQRVKYETVIGNRRQVYTSGQVPNKLAKKETGSQILFLLASCDTQDNGIYWKLTGYCEGGVAYDIEFEFLTGDPRDPENEVYGKLRKKLLETQYAADDGVRYEPYFAVIDAGGHATEQVEAHCMSYGAIPLIMPIMGEQTITEHKKKVLWKAQPPKDQFPGLVIMNINTVSYKNRLAHQLMLQASPGKCLPDGYKNYPCDYKDTFFKQFESEKRVVEKNPRTGLAWREYWVHNGMPNHAWDCEVYNMFAYDFFAYSVCAHNFGLEGIDWQVFWEFASGRSNGGVLPFAV